MTTRAFQKIYTKIDNITKATVTLRAQGVGNDELATVGGKLAQVVKIMGENVTLQVFAGTEGLATDSEVVFHGEPPKLRVSDNLAGRFFNAYGEPLEGGEIVEGEAREIGGPTVNPFRRIQPSELIATGIAGIDLNNTIVTGQKIPFFADPDQPYNAVMANVALRAKADKIILGGMGLSNDDFLYFKSVFENAGALDRIVSFVNTTENPPVERLLVPDMALTAAEYFAVDKGEKVLVLLTDMTLYADALAIVSNRMDQIPSKDSMPGSLYSDLAKIYEKAVQLPNGGSITIIAVTTLSGGDITKTLPAWLWGEDKASRSWKILDTNNAADSDMWIAYNLLEAGRLWKNDGYTAKGRAMLELLKKEVRTVDGLGDVILPGRVGFEKNGLVKLNPSYYPLFILKRFALEDAYWKKVYDGSLRMLVRSAPSGYAPEWAQFDKSGRLVPPKGSDYEVGSYNAIRTYLWVGMMSPLDPASPVLKKQFRPFLEIVRRMNTPPEEVSVTTGDVSGPGPAYFGACVLELLGNDRTAGLIRTTLAADPVSPDRYYGNVLNLYGLGFDDKRFAFDADGRLVLPRQSGAK